MQCMQRVRLAHPDKVTLQPRHQFRSEAVGKKRWRQLIPRCPQPQLFELCQKFLRLP